MNILKGSVKNCKTKKVTLWAMPFYNHWYGIVVYDKKPTIDNWGLDKNGDKGHETSCALLFDYLGLKCDYEDLDYNFHKKKFENAKGGWNGGLCADLIKIEAEVLVDRDGNIILP